MKTFQEFQATRKQVASIGNEISNECDFDQWDKPQPGYVYDYDGFSGYIELQPDGQLLLTIANNGWLEPASELEFLERELYEYVRSQVEEDFHDGRA
jgi:hypothetical protein